MLDIMVDPQNLPDWLTEEDLDRFASAFEGSGFTGGLNWYRAIELSWQLMAPWERAALRAPALYVVGDRDLVYNFPGMRGSIEALTTVVPGLRGTVVLDGCGHWTQQERPREVNQALVGFLAEL
jgi:pimeloyl-ACP methyl ester carboxylesterase